MKTKRNRNVAEQTIAMIAEEQGVTVLRCVQLETRQRRFAVTIEVEGVVARAESTSRHAALARAYNRAVEAKKAA